MEVNQSWLKNALRWLYPLIILGVSVLLYATILSIGIPDKISQILLSEASVLFFLASLIFLYFAYLPSGWVGTFTSFAGTLTLFAIQLSGVWRSGLNLSAFVLSGLLTMTDTAGYYSSALNLLEGGTFQGISAWRPLAHGVLATLLGLTQQNFQMSLALLVMITAIACFFLTREIQRTQGTIVAALLLTITFMYYRVYLGTASTESLGLALGALGLAFIWRGATQSLTRPYIFGLFLLTLALNTRAGTFFILPALLIWGAVWFRGTSRFSFRFMLGGVSAILLGFLLNSLIFKLTSPPDAVSFSNFSYSLYGLLVNGNWQTIFRDHPELLELTDKEASARLYQIIFEILREDPLSLVRGCLRAWKVFLWDDVVFGFVATASESNAKINVTLQLLSIIGLLSAYRQRQTPTGSLTLATTVGIFLSVPFLPPWDGGMRFYMATVPFIALIPSLGLAAVVRKMQWQKLQQFPTLKDSPFWLWLVGGFLVLLTVGGIIIIKFLSHSPNFAQITCPVGREIAYFRNTSGSSIQIVADNAIRQSNIPNIRVSDFRRMVAHYEEKYGQQIGTTSLTKALSQLSPPVTITNKLNLKNEYMIWLVRQNPLEHRGIIGVCGTFSASVKPNQGYAIFYTDSEIPL